LGGGVPKGGTEPAIGEIQYCPEIMKPTYLEIATAVLTELEHFDSAIGPEGLYASEERGSSYPGCRWGQEWTQCLVPCLANVGAVCNGSGGFRENSRHSFCSVPGLNQSPGTATATFHLSKGKGVEIDMIKISKIKVRKYGDTFRVDPHFDFFGRWESLRLSSYLRHFQPKRSSPRFLLMVGFDGRREAFLKEVNSLKDDCNWEKLGWSMLTHSWQDPHHRGFNTRAALWFPSQTISEKLS
jgi:hypothetical protein